mgnify:CR=1 FL=1
MSERERDRVLALAGMFQAAVLVRQVARKGMVDQAPLGASIGSVLMLDAADVPSLFGGPDGVAVGLRTLRRELAAGAHDREVIGYVLALAHLERKLARRRDLMATLQAELTAAADAAAHYEPAHPNLLARLADLYSRTVSTLTPRIIVTGEPGVLDNPGNADRVRALLLAGIRAAVLWRQKGGGRLQLLWQRKRTLRIAGELLTAAEERRSG